MTHNNTPVDRVRIFDRSGAAIAEFRAKVDRSWVVGSEGRAQFTYSTRKTNVVNVKVLNFGNWMLVENDQLPPWFGVIDTPRDWSTRNVTVYAYSPEHVLGWRIGPPEEVVNGSAGKIFQHLLRHMNAAESTIIQEGNIWNSSIDRQQTLNPEPLSKYLSELWEQSGEDYSWTYSFDSVGRFTVFGNWLPIAGAETGVLLQEGKGGGNIEAVGKVMVEDGPIVNRVLAFGDGETWNSKPTVTVNADRSWISYGLREQSQEYAGVVIQATLYENSMSHLLLYQQPARSFSLNALNVGDTFKSIGLGNVVKIRFENIGFSSTGGGNGFEGRVRIVGMRYNPANKNKIELVVREIVGREVIRG
jgi:hypothetical protein